MNPYMHSTTFRLASISLVLLLLSSCGADSPSSTPASLIRINSGEVIGFEHDHATFAWKGIPYAAPPVNELRWRAPRPVQPWSEKLEATKFGSACVQPPNREAGSNAPESEYVVGQEDCLTLNVFAPPLRLA